MAEAKEEGATLARYDFADIDAIQALKNGVADENQQKRALNWILENACARHVWAFKDDERETCIALGQQFAGQQIIGLINLSREEIEKQKQEARRRNPEQHNI